MSTAENEPVKAAADAAPQQQQQQSTELPAPVIEGKVFVGNLPFRLTDGQLNDLFAAVGSVKFARISTYGPRSRGFGFVEFDDPASCDAAIKKLDGHELDGRKISVEKAKVKPEQAWSERRGVARGRGRRGRGRPAFQGERRQASRVDDRPANNDGEDAAEQDEYAYRDTEGVARGQGARRGRFNAPRGRRRPREARPLRQPSGDPSTTSVFVAGLPFSLDDDGLKAIFDGFRVKTSKVVRLRSGRSKGFGFVEFESNEDQVRALQEVNGRDVDGRTIAVKVALSDEPVQIPAEAE